LKKNRQLFFGLIFLFLLLVVTLIGPYLPVIDNDLSEKGSLIDSSSGKITLPPFKPSSEHWLGTDRKGVDLLSRIVVGTKDMLIMVGSITLLRFAIAIPFGLFAFYSGIVRTLLHFLNLALSFVPAIFMIILLVNMPYLMYSSHRVILAIILIALLDVGRVADMLMKQVQILSQKPYIEAAITLGTSPKNIMKRYYLPILLPDLLVSIILDLGRTTFIIGQLGIIGIYISHKIQVIDAQNLPVFEVQNTSNAWPLLFENIFQDIFVAPWIPLSAAIGITLIFLGFYTLAEGLRKYFTMGQHYL
jgi:peptide/nickel transport system permease protein